MDCYHCGEKNPRRSNIHAEFDNKNVSFCCNGCRAVAIYLYENDCQRFYEYRQDQLPQKKIDNINSNWSYLDQASVFKSLTQQLNQHTQLILIKVDDMYCSACAWLLNKQLQPKKGISDVRINSMTHIVHIEFDPDVIKLSEIFTLIEQIGYQAVPQKDSDNNQNRDKNDFIKKLAVAGVGMMFIMTLSVPLYTQYSVNIDAPIKRFFSIVSLLVATLVYFYSGKDFINNALRDLKNKHLGMDVPIAISLALTYFVSVYNTFIHSPHIYFDSMSMFVFFILIGRFIESQLKHKGMNVKQSLMALIPVSVNRQITKNSSDTIEIVPLEEINKGDKIKVYQGETIPCDGYVLSGSCHVNESILTGESISIEKTKDNKVLAGSVNTEGEIVFVTTTSTQNTFLAKLTELMELAQSRKPKYLQQVDAIASYFIGTVLFLATITFIWYTLYDPSKLMQAVVSILVATCPCALSLATPAALSAAGIKLLKHGILTNNTGAITQLKTINNWFFDKTGTLTESELSIDKIHTFSDKQEYMSIANAMQNNSNHPISSAFNYQDDVQFNEIKHLNGLGIYAKYNNQEWRIGSKKWMNSLDIDIPQINPNKNNTLIYLACDEHILAIFELKTQLRKGSLALINELKKQDVIIEIVSGDSHSAVQNCANELTINAYKSELLAEEKIDIISGVQKFGKKCVMVGDGVNDAPVLSQADVSISLKQGSYLAHSASDFILLGSSLDPLNQALKISKKTNVIIKQNISWSILYNLSVIPVAMMGLLEPWVAAIGMSLSSLIVVLNSRRLL
jgi:Cu2+-exporting ATPase